MPEGLPREDGLVRKILLYTAGYSLLGSGVISLYLYGLLRLSSEGWRGFVLVVLGVFALILPAMLLAHRGIFMRLAAAIEAIDSDDAEPADLEDGFAAVSDFPRHWFVWGLLWWGLGGLLVAGGMLIFDDSFGLWRVAVVVIGTLSVSFLTDIYYFFSIKRILTPFRLALAARLGDIEGRANLVRGPSLRTKLLASFCACILVSLIYSGLLAQLHVRDAVRNYALSVQERVLDSLVRDGATSMAQARPAIDALGGSVRIALFDPRLKNVLGGEVALGAEARHWIEQRGESAGTSQAFDPKASFSWRRIPGDGRVWVASTPAAELERSAGVDGFFLGLVLFAGLVAMGVAYLLARDFGEAIRLLGESAERIAACDLRHGHVFDSEDELGTLGRTFERMGVSLRHTVQGVIGAADRMQTAAGSLRTTSSAVAEATESQLRGLFDTGCAMAEIDSQAGVMSESAGRLDAEVDATSSSVLQLESTGNEVSRSAGVLSETVDEVGSSVDQLAVSVDQVEKNATGLLDIADQTAGSMNRAAQGMRVVNSTADEIARLSGEVVTLSEVGRTRVRETIDGMQEIHRATNSAERVIGGLTQSSAQIDGVVGVIDGVADETSLLALNAAIIAAQAGENGQAFAVVADEVRALAKRVSANTRSIAEVIQTVQRETEEARSAVEKGSQSVSRGVELSGEAGQSLDEIATTTQEASGRIAEIARTVEEQVNSMNGVAELMGNLRSGTSQINEAIHEQGRSTQTLREGSQVVRDISRQLQNSSTEQMNGTTCIRQSMQAVRESVAEIHSGLREQASACRQISDQLAELRTNAQSNQRSVGRLDEASGGLEKQAESLRQEVARFRL